MRLANVGGRAALITGDRALDVFDAGGFGPDPMAVLADWTAFTEWARSAPPGSVPVDPDRLGPPVPRPRQVFAVALNYPPHAAEAGFEPPADPLVFTKFPTCIAGPRETVELPGDRVDWEVELVAAIGRGGHRIPEERALDHVAGFLVGQDLSERRVQLLGKPPQFSLAKSFPGFGPTGPHLTTVDELPGGAAITCLLNGSVVQSASIEDMIFGVPELVSRLSAICALLPGDLIFTGTPGGVGNRMDPPRYLTPDDVLISRIDGLGELTTTFREGADRRFRPGSA
ncbi:fumarylacetoacetate hydrolase family protein [Amycolatopsis sp. A133]|uniref:fumarylacetoacetate hydrolase family protein n=1 Tax=Amycolatopsis sp. A133 TaxID=3064472 RepID=UPI0027E9452A|nr:fumarylacetoacetate hydrolase family protein [Amycolatopsis sp. A133]MDQ7810956.1 fumarylacetoacetate hydrolase family protein [Amycolatopsis sp. A133]